VGKRNGRRKERVAPLWKNCFIPESVGQTTNAQRMGYFKGKLPHNDDQKEKTKRVAHDPQFGKNIVKGGSKQMHRSEKLEQR